MHGVIYVSPCVCLAPIATDALGRHNPFMDALSAPTMPVLFPGAPTLSCLRAPAQPGPSSGSTSLLLPSCPSLHYLPDAGLGARPTTFFSFCIFSILEFRVQMGLLSPLTVYLTCVLHPYITVIVACLIHTITPTYIENSPSTISVTLSSQRTV